MKEIVAERGQPEQGVAETATTAPALAGLGLASRLLPGLAPCGRRSDIGNYGKHGLRGPDQEKVIVFQIQPFKENIYNIVI